MNTKSETLKETYTQQCQVADKAVEKSSRTEYIEYLGKQAEEAPARES